MSRSRSSPARRSTCSARRRRCSRSSRATSRCRAGCRRTCTACSPRRRSSAGRRTRWRPVTRVATNRTRRSVNNAETLAQAAWILAHGADAFRAARHDGIARHGAVHDRRRRRAPRRGRGADGDAPAGGHRALRRTAPRPLGEGGLPRRGERGPDERRPRHAVELRGDGSDRLRSRCRWLHRLRRQRVHGRGRRGHVEVPLRSSRAVSARRASSAPARSLRCSNGSARVRARTADLGRIAERLRIVADGNRCYLPVQEQIMISSILRGFPEDVAAHLEGYCRVRATADPDPEDHRPRRRRRHLRRAPGTQTTRLDVRRLTATPGHVLARRRPRWIGSPEPVPSGHRRMPSTSIASGLLTTTTMSSERWPSPARPHRRAVRPASAGTIGAGRRPRVRYRCRRWPASRARIHHGRRDRHLAGDAGDRGGEERVPSAAGGRSHRTRSVAEWCVRRSRSRRARSRPVTSARLRSRRSFDSCSRAPSWRG